MDIDMPECDIPLMSIAVWFFESGKGVRQAEYAKSGRR